MNVQMDFFRVVFRENEKKNTIEIFPDFVVTRSKDLLVRGHSFYAIWDEDAGLWTTDEYRAQELIDQELTDAANIQRNLHPEKKIHVKYAGSFSSGVWTQFTRFINTLSDNARQLDNTITFANTEVRKTDYVSKRLPYALEPGDHSAWDELVQKLYAPGERTKFEWAIGSILKGDSPKIQKFLVFYGSAGTGKSTILNIIQQLFDGYYVMFEAKTLVGNNNTFATEMFRTNPLVAIQHDGDLSRIEDNTKLNSLVSHEDMVMNVKYQSPFMSRCNAMLFMGTNRPVRITDAKSGMFRRLIDVNPTEELFNPAKYHALVSQIGFELGAIAHHCLEVYEQLGKNYYNSYRPVGMQYKSDPFFNFIEHFFDIFAHEEGITLSQAYDLYKNYSDESGATKKLPRYIVREELKNYFAEFHERYDDGIVRARSYYKGFAKNRFTIDNTIKQPEPTYTLDMEHDVSLLDGCLSGLPAQLAKSDGSPAQVWSKVTTTLHDINTRQLHYVKLPPKHIVIDFDLKDNSGNKSLALNIEAAANFPPTYAELSKSGSGVHLHYIWGGGDPAELDPIYSDGIEVKHYVGNSSLRRRLTKCNATPIATINTGLPLREKKVSVSPKQLASEKALRDMIEGNLKKKFHPGTKPSVDFIHHLLEEAYSSGIVYDVTDLRGRLIAFANNSTNQAVACLKLVQTMRFKSSVTVTEETRVEEETPLVFFDVEVYPNLLVVCWKYAGSEQVVSMVNPSAKEVEALFQYRLVGFNNRRYDNHILWARYMGYDNARLYHLSQRIIDNDRNASFGEAYGLSHADVYDFSSIKQSLKKFAVQLELPHIELDLPWDQPVADSDIPRVIHYCSNDVRVTESVFESRKQDYVAREILAALSGLAVNDTTQKHTARIIFGKEKAPQNHFVYTRLDTKFPGYVYAGGKSTYKGVTVGEGGYVFGKPGIYRNVAVLDVASMHPTSIEILNLFGDYTPRFVELKVARLAIKHGKLDEAKKMLGGKIAPYLSDNDQSKALSYALKIIINIVYGLTSAAFENPFRDVRNKDNIVAKHGALTMIDLKEFIEGLGYEVIHIKTDSVKIPEADDRIIKEVIQWGRDRGYEFEHENTYDKFCLVNDAVYIACKGDAWTAVGAQFQHPYVFKRLFTGEDITRKDYSEAKSVSQGAMYLDFTNEDTKVYDPRMKFVGKTGLFLPVTKNGGRLYRVKDGKVYSVTGTKGYTWVEVEQSTYIKDGDIDYSYFDRLSNDAIKAIEQYGSYDDFVRSN